MPRPALQALDADGAAPLPSTEQPKRNAFDVFFDGVVNLDDLIKNPQVATWRRSTWVAVVQGFLVFTSLIDYTVFTVLFIYGASLAIRTMPRAEKVLPIIVIGIFLTIRFFYLPFLTVLMPIDRMWYFPKTVFMVSFIGLAFMYVIVLLLPLVLSIAWAFKYRIWRNANRRKDKVLHRAKRRVRKRIARDRIPQLIVVMPIYNEEPDALKTAVESVIDCIYPKSRITIFLSFDDNKESNLFLELMSHLTSTPVNKLGKFAPRVTLYYKGAYFIINRFPHGGKRNAQALTFEQINEMYGPVEDKTYVLFIDSDIVLYPDCMIEFVRAMEKSRHLVGMTGFISAMSSQKPNLLVYFQDCEYVVGQVFWRSLEAALGGVTCLPGALTILRLRELSKAAKTYFSELNTKNMLDFHRFHLGEDRYLTHLLMEQTKSYSIGFCPSARAKTEAPSQWPSFLKQRRRWLLGAFANQIYFFAAIRLWIRTPLLILVNFCDFSSRSVSFFFSIVVVQLLSGVRFSIMQTLLIWTPLALNWLLLVIFALLLRRAKLIYMFPVMVLVSPWASFFVNLCAIWTWNVRSWGGPRAQAVKANPEATAVAGDSNTSGSETDTLNDENAASQPSAHELIQMMPTSATSDTGDVCAGVSMEEHRARLFGSDIHRVTSLASLTDISQFNSSQTSLTSSSWDTSDAGDSDDTGFGSDTDHRIVRHSPYVAGEHPALSVSTRRVYRQGSAASLLPRGYSSSSSTPGPDRTTAAAPFVVVAVSPVRTTPVLSSPLASAEPLGPFDDIEALDLDNANAGSDHNSGRGGGQAGDGQHGVS
ncbi:hypothetical protein HK105_204972 [Polyrhizophydium stewartii]|uniref:chitin synthase n=1 Tax=Polyrhizophydium stewartii TaxID=2732419 RepID=A0ABR4N7T1_9FUNG